MARLVEFPSPFSVYQFDNSYNNDSDHWSISLDTYLGWTIAPPIILAFGTFGNIMTIVILCRLESSSLKVFFQALAISDLFVLYTGLFPVWIENSLNASFRNIHAVTCKLFYFFAYSMGTISGWLIVVMTLHRAVSIVFPLHLSIMFSYGRTLQLVFGISGYVLLLHVHMLYGYDLTTASNTTSPECSIVTKEYNWFIGEIWLWISVLSNSLLPFVLLAFSNTALVWSVKTSVKKVTNSSAQTDQRALRQKKASSLTVTLIIVSITFVLLSLPIFIHHIIRYNVFARLFQTHLRYQHALSLSHCITLNVWYCNYTVNFYIYSLTGTKFRQKVKQLFCKSKANTLINMKGFNSANTI